MKDTTILTEKEAVELFVYLLATARVQIDDPDHYGPMRLLAAAETLRDFMVDRASAPVQQLFKDTESIINDAHSVINDAEELSVELDRLSVVVAQFLIESSGLKRES